MKPSRRRAAAILQRLSQAVFLVLFLLLVFGAGAALLPADAFLRLDPLAAGILPILNRAFLPELIPGLVILAATLLAGRFFCGYVCPLGSTLDLVRAAFKTMLRPFTGLRKDKDESPAASIAAPPNSLTPPTGPSPHTGPGDDPLAGSPEGRAASLAAGGSPAPAADEADKIITRGWFQLKYMALMIVLVAALLGVNAVPWGAPLSLAARFYALLLEPLLRVIGEWGLAVVRPLTADAFWHYAILAPRAYAGLTFLLVFFGLLFVLELAKPRFWCRYFCPAGALLGRLAHVAPWRRRVKKCVSCGACARNCPTEAITPDGLATARRECIACRACVDVCPVRGVTFTCNKQGELAPPEKPAPAAAPDTAPETAKERAERDLADLLEAEEAARQPEKTKAGAFGLAAPKSASRRSRGVGSGRVSVKQVKDINELAREERPFTCTLPSRRAFLGASAVGALLSFVHVASAKRLLSRNTGPRSRPAALLRPPGALPEMEFLSRCTRCGLCMKVCPSNGLQPAWSNGWIEDIFSPVLMARRGPCEPDCNACGRVCPTGAIAPLGLPQKQWAKMGTAEVQEARCLAFAENRACVVCQEVCPFGAIDLVRAPNVEVAVPKVDPKRCFGCGYCEKHCPTPHPAIIAKPDAALRLPAGADYPAAAKAAGLSLVPRTARAYMEDDSDTTPAGELPPGFIEQ